MTPEDQKHIPSFTHAMERVVEPAKGSVLPLTDVYRAAQSRLRADGQRSMPLGAFRRLCKATGLTVTYRDGSTRRVPFIHQVRLTDADK